MATVQGFLTAYLIASACGQLVLGPLSDAYGRRVILLPALAGFAVLSFAAAATTHVAMLFGLRLLQGLCGCACVIITRAVIRDINTRTGTARDMAAILLVVSLMPPVSQTLGGLLATMRLGARPSSSWVLWRWWPASSRSSGFRKRFSGVGPLTHSRSTSATMDYF